MECARARERLGRLSRRDPRIVREPAGPHDRGSLRTHLPTDRPAAGTVANSQVPERHGTQVAAGPGDSRAAQKNLAQHVAEQALFTTSN